MFNRSFFSVAALVAVGLTCAACSKSADKSASVPAAAETKVAASGHTHEGWWCKEHGVPEEVCAQCDAKLVADFKAKGDWCQKHNRPDSQCFICHPEKEADFASLYEAKYGEKAPKPEADDAEHEKQDKT
jgi:hypothetical protein